MSRSNPNRQTFWPSANDFIEDLEPPQAPPPQNRWTTAFDNEARAARMSMMVSNTLLPAPISSERQWPAARPVKRNTYITPLEDLEDQASVWSKDFATKSFDLEKRQSFSSYNSIDFDKPKRRDSLKPEQLAQADGGLAAKAVLEYEFDGSGTEDDPYLVHWIPDDPANPMEFNTAKKWTNAMILAFAIFMVSIASSGFSQGTIFPSCYLPTCCV